MSSLTTNVPKTLDKPTTSEEFETFLNIRTEYDPADTIKQAEMAIANPREYEKMLVDDPYDDGEDEEEEDYGGLELIKRWTSKDDPLSRAMTLFEFQNGALMVSSIPDQYRTFAVDMSRRLQEDYHCSLQSEKALAELATINFIRTIEVQRKITNFLDINSLTDNGVKYLAIMSKELDRANRHFLAAIQTLNMLKQPPVRVNVKADTAILGQNQFIQENKNVKPI